VAGMKKPNDHADRQKSNAKKQKQKQKNNKRKPHRTWVAVWGS